ncbi:class I SAM-dependent methyltransferase [Streptomyces specialis]|uniref:class I SAM-dependent methyltransferase n=1 Tax=Streptomyces specialis TaxID=498367 RepID=UPI00073F0E28|nr:class I SAM-dependent methyltransferase [Streptomyces specialis]
MTISVPAARLYGDLARWWPLISPVEGYEEDAGLVAGLFALAERPVREVLDLGSGGGHTAHHLRSRYAMTLVDLSPDMLAVSRDLNPGVEHLLGDMRDLRLDRAFDAVLAHDAIAYMTTPRDLSAAFRTAFAHCRPGGVAVFLPDHVADTFEPVTDCGGGDADDGSGARYLEWNLPPDPGATTLRTEYTFTLRETGHMRCFYKEECANQVSSLGGGWRYVSRAGPRSPSAKESGGRDRTMFIGPRPPV